MIPIEYNILLSLYLLFDLNLNVMAPLFYTHHFNYSDKIGNGKYGFMKNLLSFERIEGLYFIILYLFTNCTK